MKPISKLTLSAALFLGLLVSLLIGHFFHNAELKSITIEFQKDITQKGLEIEQELAVNFHALYSLKLLFDSSTTVTANDFNHFALGTLEHHLGMHALEWAPKVVNADREKIETLQPYNIPYRITEYDAESSLQVAKQRDEYFPILFGESLSDTENNIGYDLASNDIRRTAIQKAAATGKIVITQSQNLTQNKTKQLGFLAFLPVYNTHYPLAGVDKGEQKRGVVIASFIMKDLIEHALKGKFKEGIELTINDVSTTSSEMLYRSNKVNSNTHENLTYDYPLPSVGDRSWIIKATANNTYLDNRLSNTPIIIFLLALTIISGGIIYINNLRNQTDATEKAVVHRTIELNQAKKDLERISLIDEMTGVANRRHFDNNFIKEWKHGLREKTPLTLVIIDIDYFKHFNDNYGHLAGDSCIQNVAQCIQQTLRRPDDLLARYGGEEFAIIAPNTSDGFILAELCRQRIELLAIPHAYSKVAKSITVSVGFATLVPSNESTPDKLFKMADQALYQAKASGRNQSVAFKHS